MLSLSVFVFAFNEEKNLRTVIADLDQYLKESGRDYELVIIDDGSTDGTGALADILAKEIQAVSVIHHDVNQGLGSVYKTAFAAAKKDLLTFYSSDGQFPAFLIGQFLPLMDEYDMVLGYIPDRKSPLWGVILSAAEKLLLRILFGPVPRHQGMIMFRRSILSMVPLKSEGGRGWGIFNELIIRTHQAKFRMTSIPTVMRPRMDGKSKVNNLRTVWANLKQVLALRFSK